jgi:hypothetical protein
MTIKRKQPVSVIVTVAKDSDPNTNTLRIRGPAPQTIGIKARTSSGDEWNETNLMDLMDGKYSHTFAPVREHLEYMIDVNAVVVKSTGGGAGPYEISVEPEKDGPYAKGYELAVQYRNGKLQSYRLVIALHPLSSPDRDEFLQGFKAAYEEANDIKLGEKYVDILKQSLERGVYEQAFEQGVKHVNGQVTHAQIQNMIRRSIGISSGSELGWKSGYIEGFVHEMLKKKRKPKESLYKVAEAMYNSLRWIIG